MSLQSLLDRRMDVQRISTRTTNPAGDVERTYAARLNDKPCRVQPIPSSRSLEFLRMNIPATHRVYHDKSIVLTAEDRLVIDDVGYQVLSVEYATENGRPSVAIVEQLTELSV